MTVGVPSIGVTIEAITLPPPNAVVGAVTVNAPSPGASLPTLGFLLHGEMEVALAPPLYLEARCGGRLIGHWPAALLRQDGAMPVAEIRAVVSSLDLPPVFTVEFTVRTQGAPEEARHPVLTLNGHRPAHAAAQPGRYRPLLLVSLGRSGSTYAMHLLGAHPAVVCRRQYPYETRYAQYLTQAALVRVRPADLTAPDLESFADHRGIRPNPYFRADEKSFGFFAGEAARAVVRDTVAQADQFHDWLAASQGKSATAFIEKAGPVISQVKDVETVFGPAGVIVLVRDFRDTIASALAFNAKRAFPAFGRETVDSDAAFVDLIAAHAATLGRFYTRLPEAVLLRYEELLARPRETLTSLLGALGLPCNAAILDAMLHRAAVDDPDLIFHRTAPSAADSVGRWRTDLPSALAGQAAEALAASLAQFGYE